MFKISSLRLNPASGLAFSVKYPTKRKAESRKVERGDNLASSRLFCFFDHQMPSSLCRLGHRNSQPHTFHPPHSPHNKTGRPRLEQRGTISLSPGSGIDNLPLHQPPRHTLPAHDTTQHGSARAMPPLRGFKSLMAGALLLILSPILLMKSPRSGGGSFLGARRLGRGVEGRKSVPWVTETEGTFVREMKIDR